MYMKKILSFLFLLFSIEAICAVDTISLEIQTMTDEKTEQNELINNVLMESGIRASRRYGEYITAEMKSVLTERAEYRLQISAYLDGENPLLSVTFTKNISGEVKTYTLLGEISRDTSIYLSEVIFKLWTELNPELIIVNDQLPLFLEEIPSRYIIEAAVPGSSGYSTAASIAVKNNGNIVIGMSSYCFELNENFKLISQIGKDLTDQNHYTYAFGVSVTPGGTVYMKPANGRNIYKVLENMPRSLQIRAGIEVSGPIAVLNNGVVILLDLTARRFVRIEGNKRTNIDLNLGPYTYVMAMNAGPEGNLWIFDPVEQRIKIYTDKGNFIDSISPVGLKGKTLSPQSMAIYPDGSILLYSNGTLYKFNKTGIPLWEMDGYQFRGFESFPTTPLNIAIDADRGYIYLADYSGSRVLKLYEPANTSPPDDRDSRRMIEINSNITRAPELIGPLWDKIEYYYTREAWIPAKIWLEELLNVDPYNDQAEKMISQIKIGSLLEQAMELKEETIDTIKRLGPESARPKYSLTVQLYEEVLSLHPENKEIKDELNRFKESFNQQSGAPENGLKPINISHISLENIFPSLIHYYQKNPLGTITVTNNLDRVINNVQAELQLRQYIDYPVKSELISSLGPGESAEIELMIMLNDKAFNIEEDLPLLGQISVICEVNRREYRASTTKGITLHKRTALSWDNTAKLAVFIMPNEGIVSTFSHRVLEETGKSDGIPSKMFQAARIYDALGTYGITYIEDPDSPLSQIMEQKQYVDTVRYPRTTLNIHSGDCDDSTALLASLFESSGIKTAIMTSPGHVFLAFNSEEPYTNKWIYESSEHSVIEHMGTLWIPLETTVLSEGFITAWETASTIISRNKASDIDFLPVEDQRESFPPLPVSESNFTVVEPEGRQIAVLFEKSIIALEHNFYNLNVRDLTSRIVGSNIRQKRQLNNKLGILHGKFHQYDKAENLFKELILQDSSYLSPYMNLGNLYYSQEKFEVALSIYEKARVIKPESLMINLALARTSNKLNDREETVKYFEIVKSQSKEISDRYAYLIAKGEIDRAGFDNEPPLDWMWDE